MENIFNTLPLNPLPSREGPMGFSERKLFIANSIPMLVIPPESFRDRESFCEGRKILDSTLLGESPETTLKGRG